jgi:formate-dependent nitrite reductase membrane component NrfD
MVAVYLFLGGMGAMVMAISTLTHIFKTGGTENRSLAWWGNWIGLIMLAVGSAMLFYHLLNHIAVWRVLLGVLFKPDAWIAWGTWSIIFAMVGAFWYTLPLTKNFMIIENWAIYQWFKALCTKYHIQIGWFTIANAVFTAVYTGLLLQSFPAVTLWHNPGIPVLFTVSATSTALATLLIVQYTIIKENDHALRHFFELTDAWLIGAELIIIASFYFFLLAGSEGGYVTRDLLWGSAGWVWGFIVVGLVLPFFIEVGTLSKRLPSGAFMTVSAAMMVLVGGYLLRHYVLSCGIYEYPW